ncbi:hypothetical protein PybrP1_003855 [[Pythium] brassicae (nom. inval.)]|nr:hypothetical protein PybrP1_003855 [[Pythium] brassicae (nom. inval.)]
MSSFRGLLWSLVAIAGTATAATLAYRYATRSARSGDSDSEEDETSGALGRGAARRSRRRNAANPAIGASEPLATADDEEDAEWLSESEDAGVTDGLDDDSARTQSQQMVLVAREGNLLLSVFGVVLMLLVGAVSLIIAWTSEDVPSPAELPMFAPLMWIAVGIFTAASVEVLSQSALTTPELPVLENKAVFPHDESDFALIRQHNGESLAAPTAAAQKRSAESDASAPQQPSGALSSGAPTAGLSSALAEITKTADAFSDRDEHSEAREYLLSVLPDHPDEVDVLWRLARASYALGAAKSEREEKKALAFEGLTFAEKAYATNADSAASNLWMAVLTSAVGDYRDLKDKIAGAYVIRDHAERSIELNPSDPTPHHILGNWALAFADMSWIEKRAAAAIFGALPTATYEDAVRHLHAAETLNPGGWKKNAYLLAETYHKMKRPSDAAKWALVARDAPLKTKDDRDAHALVLALTKKLKL